MVLAQAYRLNKTIDRQWEMLSLNDTASTYIYIFSSTQFGLTDIYSG